MNLEKDLLNLLAQKQKEVKELETLIADLKRRESRNAYKAAVTAHDCKNGKDNVYITILDYGKVTAKHRDKIHGFSDYKVPNNLVMALRTIFPSKDYNLIISANADKELQAYGIYLSSLIRGGK